jgi:hypothetical protein
MNGIVGFVFYLLIMLVTQVHCAKELAEDYSELPAQPNEELVTPKNEWPKSGRKYFSTMTISKRLLFPLLALLLTACPGGGGGDYEFDYETIILETPVNLDGINTRFDDYNMNLPYAAARFEIFFSSNRNSGGGQYDIVHRDLDISYHIKDDVLDVHYTGNDYSTFVTELLPLINSQSDELGPFSFFGPLEHAYFFYADNQDSVFNIRFIHYLKSDFGTYGASEVINGPLKLAAISSDKDDLYPTITEDQTQMLFCSNRDNDLFNIYSIELPEAAELHPFFTGTEVVSPVINTVLSSEGQDKCPSINGDFMVLSSDRAGGYGGFDLYFSFLQNGAWSTPVNFGADINTEFDEYRPVTFSFDSFKHLMIFSSNRPGGKGGFDLYMVRADAAIQTQSVDL